MKDFFRFALAATFLNAVSMGVAYPIVPDLILRFVDNDVSQVSWYVGWFVSSYALMQLIFAPVMGGLGDRFGMKPVLVIALVMLGIDAILQAFAPNLTFLFLARVLSGIAGSTTVICNAIMADSVDNETRVKNFGMLGAFHGLGLVVGPAIGGWASQFYLQGPLIVLAISSWILALYGLRIDVSDSRITASENTNIARYFANSWELFRTTPILITIAAAVFLSSTAMRGFESVFVLYTRERFSWTKTDAGLALSFLGFMIIITQATMAKPFVSRLGLKGVAVVSGILLTLCFVGLALAVSSYMIWPILAIGAVGGLSGPAMQTLVASATTQDHHGQIQGIFVSLGSLAGVLGPIVTTSIFFTAAIQTNDVSVSGSSFFFGATLIAIATILVACIRQKRL